MPHRRQNTATQKAVHCPTKSSALPHTRQCKAVATTQKAVATTQTTLLVMHGKVRSTNGLDVLVRKQKMELLRNRCWAAAYAITLPPARTSTPHIPGSLLLRADAARLVLFDRAGEVIDAHIC